MIINIHQYIDAPTDAYYERAINLGERGGGVVVHMPHPPEVQASAERTLTAMNDRGFDLQLVAPQPNQLMTSEQPPAFVRKWIGNYNTVVAQQCACAPERLKGLAALALAAGAPIESCFDELDRTSELGFVGVIINPDLGEGDGMTPPLSDRFWFPLYERLQALDLPALVVSAGCRDERESYSSHFITEADIALVSLLLDPAALDTFPGLKLVIGYAGGSTPYQIGRWRAHRPERDVDAVLHRLWFDTLVHTPASLRLLIKVCGADRCLFGADSPGAATVVDPATDQAMDGIKQLVETAPYLSEDDRTAIFAGNALNVFSRLSPRVEA